MALAILDGTQTATTLSTILSSGQHITAHTVVSLGTQAITDMQNAVSGSVVSVSNFPATQPVSIASVTIGNSVTISSLPAISGTVTANLNLPSFAGSDGDNLTSAVQIGYYDNNYGEFRAVNSLTSQLPVTVTNLVEASLRSDTTLPAGTNRIGVVTIGAGTVTIGAGTAQIGSVTASISNTVVTFYPAQGTAVTNTNFTNLTPSTTLVSAVAGREVLTVFNEGAGNLHISPGATATTISYQVRLSAGDYWECPQGQLSLAHTAVFATAGTARVTEVS